MFTVNSKCKTIFSLLYIRFRLVNEITQVAADDWNVILRESVQCALFTCFWLWTYIHADRVDGRTVSEEWSNAVGDQQCHVRNRTLLDRGGSSSCLYTRLVVDRAFPRLAAAVPVISNARFPPFRCRFAVPVSCCLFRTPLPLPLPLPLRICMPNRTEFVT